MFDQYRRPGRTWQDIAAEASQETNPERLLQLYMELDHLFDKLEAQQKRTAKAQTPGNHRAAA